MEASDMEKSDPEAAAPEALERADVAVGRKLAKRRNHPAVRAAGKIAKLSDQEPLYALGGALVAVGLVARKPRLASAGLRIALAVGLADLMKSALKGQVQRTRPHVTLEEHRYERDIGGSEDKEEQSFPSGHVAGAVAAAGALRRSYPRSILLGLPACGFVGWSRMAKGAHWPSDVAAGAVVGLVADALAARILSAAKGLRTRAVGTGANA
jgi:membrane-associated phospholipid phosphatase